MTEPTHNKGHTLDLIISRGLNISKVVVNDVALSDHFCVFFESTISVHTKVQTEVITENTAEIFNQVFSSAPTLPWVSVNELVDNFNSEITDVIDAIAPTKVEVVSGERRSPWRNTTLVKMEKRMT